jgi:hypothetical protein
VDKKLLAGKTVVVDSTTLEAKAAMKSTVRRDNGNAFDLGTTFRAALQAQRTCPSARTPKFGSTSVTSTACRTCPSNGSVQVTWDRARC